MVSSVTVEKRLEEIRLSSGLEIGDISRMTRITTRYLKAIERGDFSALPGDIYVRGYIKEYAKCLGVPFSEAIREYEAYIGSKRRAENGSGRHGDEGRKILPKLSRLFHQ